MNLPGLEPDEIARLIPHRPVLVGYRGSISHGTHVPPEESTGIDDVDIMAVYIPGLRDYFGSAAPPRGKDIKIREWDSAAYEVRHFVSLMGNCNANVLSLLWLKPEHYIFRGVEGDMLIAARSLFATRRAYHAFGGYANGQLKRMTSFTDPSVPSSCGCAGKFHSGECLLKEERGRGSSKRFATGFMGGKRKGLVQKFGYDVKNAAHLIRLLKMGIEFLDAGELRVDRSGIDAAELLAIKRGEWLLGDVQRYADELFVKMREARDRCTLPEEPDSRKMDALLMDILCHAHATDVVLHNQYRLGATPDAPTRRLKGPQPPPAPSEETTEPREFCAYCGTRRGSPHQTKCPRPPTTPEGR